MPIDKREAQKVQQYLAPILRRGVRVRLPHGLVFYLGQELSTSQANVLLVDETITRLATAAIVAMNEANENKDQTPTQKPTP